MAIRGADTPTVPRSRVAAWALWDCGATGVNAVVITFVFSVYLTETVGSGLPDSESPASWLGRALTIAGLCVAVLAPATGVWVNGPDRPRRALTVLTGLVVVLTAMMSLIRADHHYLVPGLVLLACMAACSDLATVPYNAMLRQLSTPATSGRVSGLGSASGFLGSVLLLLIVYFGFIQGGTADDGTDVRIAMLVAAAWLAVFAWPLLVSVPVSVPAAKPAPRVGLLGAYRTLWDEVRSEWRRDRQVVYYILASAVFRDGLTGVFTFGAVLGVTVYGLSPADVLVFGVCACTVAALGALFGGRLDDGVGSKHVIAGSLTAMIAVGLVMLASAGPVAFWICGLLLCLFIGPILASARALMMRMSADGKEGVAFGLYTTAGRAVSFLAPWMFFTFVDLFDSERAGLGGLCVVLAMGLVALLLAVRTPREVR